MRKADARLYYQNTAEYVTGQAAYWCRRNGRAFVFSVANDWDCESEALAKLRARERILYLYGLRNATAVVAQTRKQQRILLDEHKVQSVVIPMPSPPTGDGTMSPPPDPAAPRVVWVARIAAAKRLEMLLDVAEMAPEIVFEVAGLPDPRSAYTDALAERASRILNVRMLGRVERAGIPALYRGAICLCCTSSHEGFPNTFLEAWSQGVPVVSTFDPDDIIRTKGLGGVGTDARTIVEQIRRLAASPQDWQAAAQRGRDYYVENHLPANVVPRFESVFLDAEKRRV
jgi:glycosyltransferase involved in cell wall biosynthesis